jgi:methylated-DNA-[protein]-cysteine S-methyltransferase
VRATAGEPVQGFALFETAVGPCAIAWGPIGIRGVQLPEGSPAATRARVAGDFPQAADAEPPPEVRRVIDGIVSLLQGAATDLSGVPLDMDGLPEFHRAVYTAVRTIPPGETLTYGQVAAQAGRPGAARAVGQALGRNPFAIVVPCHRVVAAGGTIGGFSAGGGVATTARLLALEGTPLPHPGRGSKSEGAAAVEPGGEAPTLDFDADAALRHLRRADAALARLIDTVGPYRLPAVTATTTFEALAEAIVYQQLSGKAAATIFGRFCSAVSGADASGAPGCPTPEQVLAASDEALRACGLSGSKQRALRDLSRRTVDGEVPALAETRAMDDEAIVERLVRVRGIGRWTAEMFLMFTLGRPDVLPVDDYGLRRGFQGTFRTREMPDRDEVARRGARWAPYRSVASWYLWRAAER